ncbi:hypothetical protein [Klebsiella pneumoniae]|uniref:hypothetical protein n=1 Tax=Klebsiella pneumoniae TaxID=573 RepID=UPI000E2D83B0|nr:hypothetical protein [Klebsiella pneumoniae]MCD5893803.1 hypothetical protein [Klebsiella pneumoniae]SWT93205.1 Uncharacterised protein [Klebsiella pneumoniae]HBW9979140.1 hypothetical protein [Klebsiella pneumoniae]HCQ9088273.1 hypothetical protein [Klebsiella pneumoniae]
MNVKDCLRKIVFYINEQLSIKYSKILYKSYYDHTFKSRGFPALLVMVADVRFLIILLVVVPSLWIPYQELQSSLGSLYLSLCAASIFYLVFNLYPDILSKFQPAQHCYDKILMIGVRRKKILKILHDEHSHDWFGEADRYLSKDRYLKILSSLQRIVVEKGNGLSFATDEKCNFFEYCLSVAEENIKDIKFIKSIPNINKLDLYDSLIYLEGEMNRYVKAATDKKEIFIDSYIVAYLIHAVDKLNYYSQKELPRYVGNRFRLKFTPTAEEEDLAKELTTRFHDMMNNKVT